MVEEKELTELDNCHVEVSQTAAYVTGRVCRVCKHKWPCPTARLITDLRASRERVKELEEWLTSEGYHLD